MRRTLGLCLAIASLTGCGPATLKYVIDGSILGDVPPEQKGPIFDAHLGVAKAQDEIYRARYQQSLATKEIEVAKTEYDQAKLELDKSNSERDFADRTGDQNKIGPAQLKVEVAKLALEVAAIRRDVVDAKLDWAKTLEDTAETHVLAEMAKVEQAKAQLVVSKGKKPTTDFDAQVFDKQIAEAQKDYDQARLVTDKAQAEVTLREGKLNEAKAKLDAKRTPPAIPGQPVIGPTTPSVTPAPTPPPATTTPATTTK